MEAIQGSNQTTSNQGVQPSVPNTPAPSGSSEFDQTLKTLLVPDSANNVSEEELFSALVQERIGKTKGPEALKEFQQILSECKDSLKKPDGFVPFEDATKAALIKFRDSQKLSADETDTIYSESFAAAQLDSNTEVLFDNRGGGDDPTIAVASLEQALLLSRAQIEGFDAGTQKASPRSVNEETVTKAAFMGSTVGGASGSGEAGFLFKPISDSDGKLAVLLPPRLAGLVKGVTLVGPNGEVIESGRYSGNGNGGRDHYRFSKPGGDYPDGLSVQVTLVTSEVLRYLVRETSERMEGSNASQTATSPTSNTSSPSSATNGAGSSSSPSKANDNSSL